MTFTQLRTFAMVAELGSLRAAATALGVSEPAVSTAVAALRADLGDPLFVRTATGIALTPGGRALAARAREIVRLADRTRREVSQAASQSDRLPVLATAACAEHVVDAIVAAYTRTAPRAVVDVVVGSPECASGALADGSADLTLGVRPLPADGQAVDSVPFLRYVRVAVTAPGHPLARGAGSPARQRWLTGPAGFEPGSAEERWAVAHRLGSSVERLESEAAALERTRAGGGVMLALGHAVRDDLRQGTLVRVAVPGAPVTGLWWASIPGGNRATPAARAMQRFLTTPAATTALMARPGRTERRAPRVRVELWS
jgi:DNA-binding transcriptional LysR family regulator